MADVVAAWSGLGYAARLMLLALTGIAWSVSSLHLAINDPAFWNPVSVSDYLAVVSYSIAWLSTAIALMIVREVAGGARRLSSAVIVVAVGCALAGTANALEDGIGLRGFGIAYVAGALVGGLGMFVLAALLWSSPSRRLAFVPAIGGLAILMVVTGGGVLALVAWLGFVLVLVRERRRLTGPPRFVPRQP